MCWLALALSVPGTQLGGLQGGKGSLFLDFSVPSDSHSVSVVITINNSSTPARSRLPVPLGAEPTLA